MKIPNVATKNVFKRRAMAETSLTTVNRHYFNIDDEMLKEVVEGWSVPALPPRAPTILVRGLV